MQISLHAALIGPINQPYASTGPDHGTGYNELIPSGAQV